MNAKCIHDLPEEVFEFILSFLSPYNDLKNCMLVCKSWRKSVKHAVKRMQHEFIKAISEMHINWCHLTPDPGPTITKRYSHSACCQGTSMYVFGGCTSTSTTFNDLWRLDLASRRWIRPLSMGTYPSPKACATMVSYKDMLILFGGWTHPSPYPLHQAWRIFNQLHVYNPEENRWNQIIIIDNPPPMAGHSATIHGDKMVVFGGLQKQSNGLPFASSNDIWVLDLNTMLWSKQQTSQAVPSPRYGQSQLALDDSHALIIGGCGGPNKLYNDVWLLTISDKAWEWKELQIKKSENAAPYLLCHPACKVGDKMVILSRRVPSKVAINSYGGQMLRPTTIRTWTPPQETSFNVSNEQNRFQSNNGSDSCVNGKRGTFRKPCHHPGSPSGESGMDASSAEREAHDTPSAIKYQKTDPLGLASAGEQESPFDLKSNNASSFGCEDDSQVSNLPQPSTSAAGIFDVAQCVQQDSQSEGLPKQAGVQRNTNFPSIRPNPLKNRQRQLEGLRRMEERIRVLSRKNTESEEINRPDIEKIVPERCPSSNHPVSSRSAPVRNPLTMYVADISQALFNGTISWLPQKQHVSLCGPEEAILYSLVEGRGELIMFGGIHKDLGMSNTAPSPRNNVPETVSNTVHFITAQKLVI